MLGESGISFTMQHSCGVITTTRSKQSGERWQQVYDNQQQVLHGGRAGKDAVGH